MRKVGRKAHHRSGVRRRCRANFGPSRGDIFFRLNKAFQLGRADEEIEEDVHPACRNFGPRFAVGVAKDISGFSARKAVQYFRAILVVNADPRQVHLTECRDIIVPFFHSDQRQAGN